jgi:tetratricopeptide (TPR) repeat protein
MSQHKKLNPTEGIVTSDSIRSKKLLSKVHIIGIGSGVIILILAAVSFKYFILNPKTTSQSQNLAVTSPKQNVVKAQTELKDANTSKEKASAYYDLGEAYLSNNQPQQAISSYQNAKPNVSNELGISIGLGYAYSMTGQTTQAITAFQQVISLLEQSSNPYARNKVPIYQLLVQRLQQGKSI